MQEQANETTVREIVEYMDSISQEDTSREEFQEHLNQYSLADLMEAHEVRKKEVKK